MAGSALLPTTKALRFNDNSVHTFDLGGTTQIIGSLLLETYYLNNRIITNGNLPIIGNAGLGLGGGIGTIHDFTGLTSFAYDGSGAIARAFILNQGGAAAGTVQVASACLPSSAGGDSRISCRNLRRQGAGRFTMNDNSKETDP